MRTGGKEERVTEEERAAMRWLHCEESADKVEEWRKGWEPGKTADAGRLARSCYAEGFFHAAVRAYRRVTDGRYNAERNGADGENKEDHKKRRPEYSKSAPPGNGDSSGSSGGYYRFGRGERLMHP